MEFTDSILDSMKKLLGISNDYNHFDQDIIIHINTAFMSLRQIGVGPKEGFVIHGSKETWGDFLPDMKTLESVRTYLYLKVRLIFDPPTNSAVVEIFNKNINEIEWRLNSEVDYPLD